MQSKTSPSLNQMTYVRVCPTTLNIAKLAYLNQVGIAGVETVLKGHCPGVDNFGFDLFVNHGHMTLEELGLFGSGSDTEFCQNGGNLVMSVPEQLGL